MNLPVNLARHTDPPCRRQAIPAIAVGHVIIAIVMVLNGAYLLRRLRISATDACHCAGTIGARLHVPFPVLNRSSFGFWFSYFSVISRVVLAMFWFGIQVCSCASLTMEFTELIF